MKKSIFIILLAIAASMNLFAQTSGTCGDSLTWSYDVENHVLTISGSGVMDDYVKNHAYDMPWRTYLTSIKSIIFPDSITSIGNYAFYCATSLTSVTIPEGVTRIGYKAFNYCTNLDSIILPNSVTSIGSAAFAGCKFTSISIPNNVSIIGSYAFSGCSGLTSLIIPNSVTSIGDGTFYGCSGLKSVIIPNNVTSIGKNAFALCSSLTSVTIPNSVKSIGLEAFIMCYSLHSVTLSDSLTNLESNAFSYCHNLTSIIIPNSLTSIGVGAFAVTGLTSVTIPNSLTHIGDGAFAHTHLTSVTIPSSVTSIGQIAFEDCAELSYITCLAPQPPTLGSRAFSGVDKNTPLIVIKSSLNLYKAADQWKDFTRILAIPDSTCGTNLAWTIHDSVLTIAGTGAMYNYSHPDSVPWLPQYGNSITNVVIENGVTSIGDKAFNGCSHLVNVM